LFDFDDANVRSSEIRTQIDLNIEISSKTKKSTPKRPLFSAKFAQKCRIKINSQVLENQSEKVELFFNSASGGR